VPANKKHDFTRIELTVVIVILGIFVAIMIPVFNQKKPCHCMPYANQLAVSLALYAQDYDEHFPPAKKWMTVTKPYTGDRSYPYVCPTVKTENPKVTVSYAMDSRLSEINLEKLKNPATRGLVYDSTRTDWNATDPGQSFTTRHGQKTRGILIFADGRAKLVTREEFAQAVALTR
jgi:hypothetical protein